MASGSVWDVVIVGGGPAGSAAGLTAAQRGLRSLIVERHATPQPGPCAGWLGPAALEHCAAYGVDVARLGSTFTGLRLRSWDLKQCVEVHDAKLKGGVVSAERLSAALLKQAEAGGVRVVRGASVQRLQLGESAAALELSNGTTVTGQVVLIADGAASPTAELAHLGAARRVASGAACALALWDRFETGATPGKGLDLVLGAIQGLKVATIACAGEQLRVELMTRDHSSPAKTQLQAFVDVAQANGLLPRQEATITATAGCLAGTALEMESHVGKRCLLIGDAGGFVTSFSHEGIYPALRSGELAAETVAAALRAPVLQDELASFSTLWRSELAGYLRMPNTDLGLLMPMVFNNPQMSRRVARAFLLGQAF